ncbi:MAG TPA: CpsB/CapC family capsule biosynthesis tyrosine phosphatase [Longimicrobiales bacterium]|nr:CpsB/CapC family capsule biosynthesis tyrosine phosphatase [Longimicrobiales bacterium]
MSTWVDVHNHMIPGVDDGARDATESRAAIGALVADGVERVVTTPHVDGSLTLDATRLQARLAEVDRGWDRLKEAVAEMAGEAPSLDRGVELKLDVPEVDLSDERLRLAGGRAVLVEFPHMTVPPRSEHALSMIRRAGYLPLLAHPERYHGTGGSVSAMARWLDVGAYLQVNASSLLGQYGERAQTTARALLARGWVHCLASDYHARGEPNLAAVRRLLESWGGADQARVLFEVNPSRLLAGEAPHPVEPLEEPDTFRRRLRRILPWR